MSINCQSGPQQFIISDGQTYIFQPFEKCGDDPVSPKSFRVKIVYKQNVYQPGNDLRVGRGYEISMGDNNQFSFLVFLCDQDTNLKPFERCQIDKPAVFNQNPKTDIPPPSINVINDKYFTVEIQFTQPKNVFGVSPENFYTAQGNRGDRYVITLPDARKRLTTSEMIISIAFHRLKGGIIGLDSTGRSTGIRLKLNTEIEVPRIDIVSQTLVDGSDVGETIFTISDKFTYYSNNPIELKNKICKKEQIPIEDLNKTLFDKSCPKMASVFIGEGESLYDKISRLWLGLNIDDPNLIIFHDNVIRYGMLRYILSKILYGNFNINYLLRKYYKKFLTDLGHSRFCGFVQFFNNPTYSNMYKYFK